MIGRKMAYERGDEEGFVETAGVEGRRLVLQAR